MEELVLYFSLKYDGDFGKIYQAILDKEPVDEMLKNVLKGKLNCQYTTLFSHDYPECLKQINNPPFVLYYYGDLSLINKKTIGIIGMRDCDEYGRHATEYFTNELVKKGYVVVSGMAKGVDSIAHKSAIETGGKTIAVLGTGIEYCYPKENKDLYNELKKNHLVLSEYPFNVAPCKKLFPYRNRIVSALSSKILITQSRVKSGTMITAGYALEQGKDVYCVPGRFYDFEGCNKLINQGAYLVHDVKDIDSIENYS